MSLIIMYIDMKLFLTKNSKIGEIAITCIIKEIID